VYSSKISSNWKNLQRDFMLENPQKSMDFEGFWHAKKTLFFFAVENRRFSNTPNTLCLRVLFFFLVLKN